MNDQSNNNMSNNSEGSEHHPTQHSDAPHAVDIPDSQLQDNHSKDKNIKDKGSKDDNSNNVNINDACLINRSTREFNDNITGRNKKIIPFTGAARVYCIGAGLVVICLVQHPIWHYHPTKADGDH